MKAKKKTIELIAGEDLKKGAIIYREKGLAYFVKTKRLSWNKKQIVGIALKNCRKGGKVKIQTEGTIALRMPVLEINR